MEPFGIDVDVDAGEMPHARNHVVRHASHMAGYYADAAALAALIEQGDPLHYEVFEVPVPPEPGHLMYCISTLQPGVVGEECFMTKGHYHDVIGTAEVYLCLRGEGYMLMKTARGRCRLERMARGRMVYVPPCWAHRSINTGREALISFCVYPADAGHNYRDIASEGFPRRVFLRDGQVVIE